MDEEEFAEAIRRSVHVRSDKEEVTGIVQCDNVEWVYGARLALNAMCAALIPNLAIHLDLDDNVLTISAQCKPETKCDVM